MEGQRNEIIKFISETNDVVMVRRIYFLLEGYKQKKRDQ